MSFFGPMKERLQVVGKSVGSRQQVAISGKELLVNVLMLCLQEMGPCLCVDRTLIHICLLIAMVHVMSPIGDCDIRTIAYWRCDIRTFEG